VAHASFSWWVFTGLALFVAAWLTSFVRCIARAGGVAEDLGSIPRGAWPWWGWLGVALVLLTWWLAWTRFAWFQSLQEYTFSPLWLGYILVVNALTQRATGHYLFRDRTGYLFALFPLSAAFWWFFEYLNRFAQNWHYIGVGELGPWEYFWQATLPFSTVLPAVTSTQEYLRSFPRLSRGLSRAWPISLPWPRPIAGVTLLVAGLGLVGIGTWPEYLYPLVWIAPLFIIVALQAIVGEPTIFDPVAAGDWTDLWLAMLAALICGFFWELWNYGSLAHWEYSVPHVDRFDVFHMPLIGYAGYLPFGLECMAVAGMLQRWWRPHPAAQRHLR
jgi:hypothetical protein